MQNWRVVMCCFQNTKRNYYESEFETQVCVFLLSSSGIGTLFITSIEHRDSLDAFWNIHCSSGNHFAVAVSSS